MVCGFVADGDEESPCPRPRRDGSERCPLHAGRGDEAVPPSALRAAVCADLRSDDERRLVYRTRYDGFPFAAYRTFLRENRWMLHEYVGDPETEADLDGLERTYLEARQGAGAVDDHENAAAFFLREMRYRRRRYANHARDSARSTSYRVDASLRWATSAFLNAVSGYGERPQRTVLASLVVILGCALVYPAVSGLRDGETVVTYASDGAAAFADGLYFSVVTFTTLGYGDLEPTGSLAGHGGSRRLTAE